MPTTIRERGAVAVEFALVLPVLLVLVLGIIDFGRLFSAQQTLTYAARSGARVMVLQNSTTAAVSAAQTVASPLGTLASSAFSISPTTCSPGTQVTFTANLRAFPGARLDTATVLADNDWRAANTQEQPDRVVPRPHPDAAWQPTKRRERFRCIFEHVRGRPTNALRGLVRTIVSRMSICPYGDRSLWRYSAVLSSSLPAGSGLFIPMSEARGFQARNW